MKQINMAIPLLVSLLLQFGIACVERKKTAGEKGEVLFQRTAETEHLLQSLKKIPAKGLMFGHQDAHRQLACR